MIPGKLDLIVTLSAPTIDPDGSRAVVSAVRPSFEADAYVGQLWQIDIDDSLPPLRLTRGFRDTDPAFSPDGGRIAFLRAVPGGKPQLAVVDARGGEPRVLTDAPLGVQSFAWDRTGTRIAFVARRPEPLRYGTTEGVSAAQEPPRRIRGNKYQMNGVGYVTDQRTGIYLIEMPRRDEEPWVEPVGRAADPSGAGNSDGGSEARREGRLLGGQRGFPEARLLTPPEVDATWPAFSPDGGHLYFTAAMHDGADCDLRTMVHRVAIPAPGKMPQAPELVAGGPASDFTYRGPAFSHDGQTLYMLGAHVGPSGTDFVAQGGGLFAMPAGTVGEEPVALTDRDALDYGADGEGLVPHGKTSVLIISRSRGAKEVHSINSSGARRTIVEGNREISGVASDAGKIVVSFADSTSPGELGIVERVNGTGVMRALTNFAGALGRETRVAVPRELTVPSKDGHPVHGWVFTPEGPGPHPVILNIHGGPHAQYGWGWFDEPQVYTQAGYAVVQCNPRGSAGYGRDHALAIKGRMGTLDMQDVLAFLKGALKADSSLDKKRLGIMGGSYGGYLTAWTIAHTGKFQAAIVERGYLDPWAFIGTSDIGWFFSPEYTGPDVEAMEAQSPIAVVGGVATPTLVMHSEQDLRCPLEQAQRYHAALRRNGVDSEMLIFPGENHELSRSGTPWHRRERFEAILEWWGRHLPVDVLAAESRAG